MKLCFKVSLLSSVVFGLLTFIAVCIGRIMPDSVLISELTLCNNIPCYKDIVLGETSIEVARYLLENTYGLHRNPNHSGYDLKNSNIRIVHLFGAEKVQEIDFLFHERVLNVGSIVQRLGNPCAVYAIEDARHKLIVLGYSDKMVWVISKDWIIRPYSDVGQIDVVMQKEINVLMPWGRGNSCKGANNAVRFDWYGFTHYAPK